MTKLDDGLQKLDKMTNEEARMANAEVLMLAPRLTHHIDEKVGEVDNKVQGVRTQVKDVDEKVQAVDKDAKVVCIQVQQVDENVKMVGEKVQTAIDGVQIVLSLSPTPSLIFESIRRQRCCNGSESGDATNSIQRKRYEPFVITPLFANSYVSNNVTGRQLRESLRKWQAPSDPSTNHNIACKLQHMGTAEWFCDGNIFEEWNVAASLLWIHGKRTLF